MGFLKFVRCGSGKEEPRPDAASPGHAAAAAKGTSVAGRPRSAAVAAREKRRQRAPPQWRPSLGDILEDGVFRIGVDAAEERGAGAGPAPPPAKPKSTATASLTTVVAKARRWGSRQLAAQPPIPALAPTPFMF